MIRIFVLGSWMFNMTYLLSDASFQVPQGSLTSSSIGLGNFHQCLSINQHVEGNTIEGKYCMIRANIKGTKTMSWFTGTSWLLDTGVKSVFDGEKLRIDKLIHLNAESISLALCIPKVCSVEDVLAPLLNSELRHFNYVTEFCRMRGDKPLVAADYIAFAVFSLIGIFTLLSTTYDIWHRFLREKDLVKPNGLLRCFSVYTNTQRLLTFSAASDAIDCIHGIRSISTLWVIVGHTSIAFLNEYTINLFDYFVVCDQRTNMWMVSAELAVDTFLVLSGLLLVYTSTSIKKIKQMQLLKNIHVFYLQRLLRMFPLLGCAVLLQASVFNYVSDGTNWHYMAENVLLCRQYWWTALLHVQNIVNPTQPCLSHSWYLSVDVQLYVVSPLVLFWVLGTPKSAWNGLTVGLLTSLTATTVYCSLKDFSSGYDNLVYYYTNTLTRAPPFFVGMIFGYILHVYRRRKLSMPVWSVSLGYLAACAASSYCMYVIYAPWDNKLLDNFNRSFMRSLWGVSVCWIIFACVVGYGGPINWFLSLKPWRFMARISYAMYLFHYSVLFTISGGTVIPFHFSLESMFLVFLRAVAYTVICSAAACILVDAPCSTLEKLILKVLTPSARSATANKFAAASPQNTYI
ncbi:nose resistant to fluoxetine protein 6-like isoform X2 [Choristoneura fumiferana]|uniref:nose resistant to fluoxetine protein 6-like isoform X2 n=1 Tax=Choristoneura fumiferana TaxID=7141 RepID=UPI003D15C3AD